MDFQILHRLIIERKTTKTELAKHLDVSRPALDNYIDGKTSIPADKIVLAAQFFGVPVSYLFEETAFAKNKQEEQSLCALLFENNKQIAALVEQLKIQNELLSQVD